MIESGLGGRRVLVVESESRIARRIRDTLEDLGCEVVAIASRLAEARARAGTLEFDIALLDLELNGESCLEIATDLSERGIPFVLTVGDGTTKIPPELKHAPVLPKPFLRSELERSLLVTLAR
ncbi:MAG TPA: response regulator [Rhodanobacteraceae bacterium]|jgi:DNA-binding response OmpR family regulator